GRELQAQASLAHPTRTGQSQQASAVEQALALGHLGLAAHETCQLSRQVVGSGIEGAQGWEGAGRAVDHKLVKALGAREVLEPVQAQVAQREMCRQGRLDQRPGGVGNHHLASMRRSRHPRSVVYIDPDVFLADQRRLSCVHADPYANRLSVRPFVLRELSLRLGGRTACVERALEHTEKRVTLSTQLSPVAAPKSRAKDLVMSQLRLHVLVAKLLHQTGRTLDVGEEERDCSGRQAHIADPASAPPRTGFKAAVSWAR